MSILEISESLRNQDDADMLENFIQPLFRVERIGEVLEDEDDDDLVVEDEAQVSSDDY